MIWPFLMASVLLSSPVCIIIKPPIRHYTHCSYEILFYRSLIVQKPRSLKPIDLVRLFYNIQIPFDAWRDGIIHPRSYI